MIWYKSSIQDRPSPLGAKMCRGSPVCQQMREQIIEMFKNSVSPRKIGRDLDIVPSTVHNIIKRFKESGGISVHYVDLPLPLTSLGSEASLYRISKTTLIQSC